MSPHVPLDRKVNQPERCQVSGPQRSPAKDAPNSLLRAMVFGIAVIAGASISSVVSAEDEVQKPDSDPVISFKASEWKGPDIAAYGDRFKAAMQLQEREAHKPDWSWHDQARGATIVAKGN